MRPRIHLGGSGKSRVTENVPGRENSLMRNLRSKRVSWFEELNRGQCGQSKMGQKRVEMRQKVTEEGRADPRRVSGASVEFGFCQM